MTYTKDTLKEAIIQKLRLNYGCTEKQATDGEMMKACAMVLRDIMAEHGVQTREKAAHEGQRKVHYLSMEFLMGRSLMKNAYNLELLDDLTAAIDELGFKAADIFEMSEDFPAEGMPTSAASAMSFISSSTHCSCEGSPNSANAGARRVDVTKCTFPRPPTPPSATVMRSPSCVRSAMSSPVSFVSSKYSWTTVPTGTFKIMSSPSAPRMREHLPCVPRSALKWCLKR